MLLMQPMYVLPVAEQDRKFYETILNLSSIYRREEISLLKSYNTQISNGKTIISVFHKGQLLSYSLPPFATV